MQAFPHRTGAASANRRARRPRRWAEKCRNENHTNQQLRGAMVTAQSVSQIQERTEWLISAHPSTDQTKAVPTAFSSLRSLSLGWSATRLSKTLFVPTMVTVPLRPNRRPHTPQTRGNPQTTHVTLPIKGGRNFASALFRATQRCTPCAPIVHANHIPQIEVLPC